MNLHTGNNFKIWTPVTYRIKVQGYLDESQSDRLGGMTITTNSQGDQEAVTIMVGRLRDQAELAGGGGAGCLQGLVALVVAPLGQA